MRNSTGARTGVGLRPDAMAGVMALLTESLCRLKDDGSQATSTSRNAIENGCGATRATRRPRVLTHYAKPSIMY